MLKIKNEIELLKKQVFDANIELVKHGLVIFTWGNVSGIDASRKYVVIKPSGVEYETMKVDDMVVVDLDSGAPLIDDTIGATSVYRPSSDTPTHIEIYKKYNEVGSVVHTHSTYATAYAQAGRTICPFGTTHADYFYGEVPCTRFLTISEVEEGYEKNTGKVIIEALEELNLSNVNEMPGVLVKGHGPFSWGTDSHKAVHNAVVLEKIAQMNILTLGLNSDAELLPKHVLDKHYSRKHGPKAYYGQGGQK